MWSTTLQPMSSFFKQIVFIEINFSVWGSNKLLITPVASHISFLLGAWKCVGEEHDFGG